MKQVRERQISYNITYMWNIKIQTKKKKQFHRCSEPVDGCQRGGVKGKEGNRLRILRDTNLLFPSR